MTAHVSYFDQSSDQIVLDLINEQNGTEFNLSEIQITASGVADTKETTLTVVALPGSGYKGTTTHQYNRLLLSEVLYGDGVIELDAPSTIGDVIALINARYGISLSASDIKVNGEALDVNSSVAVDVNYDAYTPLHLDANAIDGGKVWVGDYTFNLTKAQQLLADVWGVSLLDGLHPPTLTDGSANTIYTPLRPGFVTKMATYDLQRPVEYIFNPFTTNSGANTFVYEDPYGNTYPSRINITPKTTYEYLSLAEGGSLTWGSLPAGETPLDVVVSLQRTVSRYESASNLGRSFFYSSNEGISMKLTADGRGNKVHDLMKQMYGSGGGCNAYLMGSDGTTYAKLFFQEQQTKTGNAGYASDEQGSYLREAVFFEKKNESFVAETNNPTFAINYGIDVGHNIDWTLADVAYVRLERAERRNDSIINLDTELGPLPTAGKRYTFNVGGTSWAASGNPINPNTSLPYNSEFVGAGSIPDVKNGNVATPASQPISIGGGADLSVGFITHPNASGKQIASSGRAVITPEGVSFNPQGDGAWATAKLAELQALYPNGVAVYTRADSSSTSPDAVQSTYLNPEVIGNGIVFKCSIPRTFLNGRVQLCEFVTNVNYWPYAIA